MSSTFSRLARISQRVRRTILLRRRLLAALLTAVRGPRHSQRHPTSAGAVRGGAHRGGRPACRGRARPRRRGERRVRLGHGPARCHRPHRCRRSDARGAAAPGRAGDRRPPRGAGASGHRGSCDQVAVPVRIPDAQAVGLLRVGDRINLLSTDPRGGGTEIVAASVEGAGTARSRRQRPLVDGEWRLEHAADVWWCSARRPGYRNWWRTPPCVAISASASPDSIWR